jgi:hypothetical protein
MNYSTMSLANPLRLKSPRLKLEFENAWVEMSSNLLVVRKFQPQRFMIENSGIEKSGLKIHITLSKDI